MSTTTLLTDVNRGYRTWHIKDVYMGPTSGPEAIVVVNVDDTITVPDDGFYLVTAVNNFIPTLSLLHSFNSSGTATNGSLITNLSGYQPTVVNRAFYNDLASPTTITLDSRLPAFGNEVIGAKLFLGTDTSTAGTVISQQFNNGGDLIGDGVDLVNGRVGTIITGTALSDGDTITLVTYTAQGPSSDIRFVVVNSSAFRAADASTTFVQDVILETELLDSNETDLLRIPANVGFTAAALNARVLYSDGTSVLLPVDGVRVRLSGLDNFNSALPGNVSQVVLSYHPLPNEPFINGSGSSASGIPRTYRVQADVANLDYAFKIFIVPRYTGSNMYVLSYYLVNLTGDLFQEITSGLTVVQSDNSPLDITGSGIEQTIDLSLQVSTLLGPTFGNFIHTQRVKLTLNSLPSSTPWLIDYRGDGINAFGDNIHVSANNTGLRPFVVSSGFTVFNEWEQALVDNVHPIFNPNEMVTYRPATHFRYIINGETSIDYPIEDWQQTFNRFNSIDWNNEIDTFVFIPLYEQAGISERRVLGVSPMMVLTDLP